MTNTRLMELDTAVKQNPGNDKITLEIHELGDLVTTAKRADMIIDYLTDNLSRLGNDGLRCLRIISGTEDN